MNKLIPYILCGAWLFALLDWKVVHLTRWTHPEYKDWMHAQERVYAQVTGTIEFILCAPCLAFKPIFAETLKAVEASAEEQDMITHAPKMDWRGFYHLPERGRAWTFLSWWSWVLYWTPPSIAWWLAARKFFR